MMGTSHTVRLGAWLSAGFMLAVGFVALGQGTSPQQPVPAPSDTVLVALTKIPKAAAGKSKTAPPKKQSISVTGPASMTVVSMSLFGAGTRVETDADGSPVLTAPAEIGLAIKDKDAQYTIEADQRTTIAEDLINKDFRMTDKGRMVIFVTPGVVLRVKGLLRGNSIEATEISKAEPAAAESNGSTPGSTP